MLQGTDAISRMAGALARGEESPVDVARFIEAFDQGESTAEAVKAPAPQEAEALGSTVRASVKTLDNLVNLIGELIIFTHARDLKEYAVRRVIGGEARGSAAVGAEAEREAPADGALPHSHHPDEDQVAPIIHWHSVHQAFSWSR